MAKATKDFPTASAQGGGVGMYRASGIPYDDGRLYLQLLQDTPTDTSSGRSLFFYWLLCQNYKAKSSTNKT